MLDAENTPAPVRADKHVNNADLTAFPLDDVHGYAELARRLAWTLILIASVTFGCIILALALRPHP